MTDFITKYHVISTVTVLWSCWIITTITTVWADDVAKNGLTAPSASLGVTLVGLFGLALLNFRKMRGLSG